MPRRIRKGQTCFGGWLSQARLAINALLIKRGLLGKDEGGKCPNFKVKIL